MKVKSLLTVLLVVVLLSSVGCVELVASSGGENVYRGIDSRVFDQGSTVVYHDTGHRKIEGPGKKWSWYNSWHVTHRQPGIFGTEIGRAPYTLTNSFAYQDFADLTWLHYSFYVYQPKKEEMRESYDCNFKEIKKEIRKKFRQSAHIIRIDKLSENFYVVTYLRNDHKKFDLQTVDGYPPFNLGGNVGMAEGAIVFDVKVKSLDPYGRAIFETQRARMSMRDVILLNPRFFDRPVELTDIFVPYSFFAHKFLYDHRDVARAFKQSGDPMVIKINKKGVVLRFSEQAILEEW